MLSAESQLAKQNVQHEPPRKAINAAVLSRWPDAIATYLNHRRHILRVRLPKGMLTVIGKSHAEILSTVIHGEVSHAS